MISKRIGARIVTALCVLHLCASTLWTGDSVILKPIELAVLKLDLKQAKQWEVFGVVKKGHLALVQLGPRNLLIDMKERAVYEVPSESLEHKGKQFRMAYPDHHGKKLDTDQWFQRDAGRVHIVRMRFIDDLHTLEVQLPIQLDLRTLY